MNVEPTHAPPVTTNPTPFNKNPGTASPNMHKTLQPTPSVGALTSEPTPSPNAGHRKTRAPNIEKSYYPTFGPSRTADNEESVEDRRLGSAKAVMKKTDGAATWQTFHPTPSVFLGQTSNPTPSALHPTAAPVDDRRLL